MSEEQIRAIADGVLKSPQVQAIIETLSVAKETIRQQNTQIAFLLAVKDDDDKQIYTLRTERDRFWKALDMINRRCINMEDYEPVAIEVGMIAATALEEGK